MNAAKTAVFSFAALSLAACAIGKPMPLVTTYVVDPPAFSAAGVTRRSEVLRMGNVRVAAAYAGNALVYRMEDVQYTTDPYHAFLAEPAGMLGNRIAQGLDRAGPFGSVAQPGSAKAAAYVLEVTVTELYGDFRKGHTAAAVMSAQFTLIDQTGARPKVVHECTLASRIELAQASPDALVRGYGKALDEILTRLVNELSADAAA